MQTALRLARRNLGQTWPNPSVGAVVVKDDCIIGQGVTARGGRPHAETEALAQAAAQARGATLYVTLEPCAHQGKTSPCAEAIITAGIARCVVACRDPNPLVNGKGIAQLQQAGIEVIERVCEEEAKDINRGFFSVMERKRPYVALKIAASLDGRVASPKGRWITSEPARGYGHLLRSRYDAIATGIGTVLADDPLLTCRLPGLEERSPVRVIFDRRRRLPEDSQLMKTADKVPVWPMAEENIAAALAALAAKGITRLLVEAGQKLSTAFLQSGLVDRVYWFRAPAVIGEEGLAAFSDGVPARWKQIDQIPLLPDRLDVFECSAA
ncbi:MAG: bifunctional diaminohydroxyphosphoribosylaminopyrimidine deaminase/5-amino-6-(5-phosphoribosylamino)uracil reductase RibD [Pseudomonadota bacterium]|nr:bifunctional diaminohydroxyphosphoribosylaminopyrimidine deaminase/5-amino-6-(5-phosphoribosylamino)uracil reductase RibD [Pseudomonadota bacterium]